MIDHHRLVREAAAEDAATELRRCADRLARVARNLDALSELKILRIVGDLRKTADLKRPKSGAAPVAAPKDVRPPC